MLKNEIQIKGAREHNLKNVSVSIPKNKLTVITGVSGSGKSSLAFDTIFAEGQRRYVESLSSYARQFLGMMEKPKFDTIRGLSPTISIEQKATNKNPRSTVGTITEIYDYLRVFYANLGEQHCLKCGEIVGTGNAQSIVKKILSYSLKTKLIILAPVVENRKGEHKNEIKDIKKQGLVRARIDGVVTRLDDLISLEKNKKHSIEVVIDRLVISEDGNFKKRVSDSVELALKLGKGRVIIAQEGKADLVLSEARSCCGIPYPKLSASIFSFNSPTGSCDECHGIGSILEMDESKIIPDPELSLLQGAVLPWANYFSNKHAEEGENDSWYFSQIKAVMKAHKIDENIPWNKISKKKRDILLYGSDSEVKVHWKSAKIQGEINVSNEGLINSLMRRYKRAGSENARKYYSKYLTFNVCSTCGGKRLKPELLNVLVQGKSIYDLTELSIKEALEFFKNLKLSRDQEKLANELIKEIKSRLKFLVNVGLDYLSLGRKGPTLSGGESQRIRLASQIGSELTGVLYILDEPSIGLHQKDNVRLIETLKHLRDLGNTVLVVEHDQEMMEHADHIIDIGPGAGALGGKIIAQGNIKDILKHKKSLTGGYLSGRLKTFENFEPRAGNGLAIDIIGASHNNLKNIDVSIPLGKLVSVTGVSGAGKSTLINQTLFPYLSKELNRANESIGTVKTINGIEHIDKVINIDQSPIGRTPRSNPATYTKLFDHIRDLFALTKEARARGWAKGRFSFNVKGGRCPDCEGDGVIKVEMHFLADVYVTCESCEGRRFNQATLDVLYRGYSIADVLNLTVLEARKVFENHPKLVQILNTLIDVGLSYLKLGQSATTLSGGEAQRIKLARELAKRPTGKTLYILDEPTTGLHFEDIRHLIIVLNRLVDSGNSVVVIEHNLDVINASDWVIDIGPDGGDRGGKLVAQGTVAQVKKIKKSHTAKYL